MISAMTIGVLFGFTAGFSPGPLLTLVINQTLRHSTIEGVKVALAPIITDVPIILASLFVLAKLNHYEPILGMISLVGGLYVLYLAYENFRIETVDIDITERQPKSIRKGVLVNALNPHPYVFWITVGAPLIVKAYKENPIAPILFLLCFYALLVGSKIALAFIVGKSRSFLTSRGYLYIMRIMAVLLAFFAFLLLKEAFTLLNPRF